MKPLNWPQATLEPNQGARLIQASWADYDLSIDDVGQRLGRKWYDQFGTGEIERFMGWCRRWEEWDGIDRREYEDWGFQFSIMQKNDRGLDVWSRVLDTGSDSLGSEYWDSEEVVSAGLLSKVEGYLTGRLTPDEGNASWDGEWMITLWHMDPTFETKIRKFGDGMCYYA